MNIELIGYLALTISVISFLPSIYNIFKTGKSNNFPIQGLILAIIGNIFWFIYGIYTNRKANIIAGFVYFLMYSYIIFKKYKE